MSLHVLQYLYKTTGFLYFFDYLMNKEMFCLWNSNLRRNIYSTAEHVFISNRYLYAATACTFRVHYPSVVKYSVTLLNTHMFYPKIEL